MVPTPLTGLDPGFTLTKLDIRGDSDMDILPLGQRVLIQPADEEEQTESGLVLPGTTGDYNKGEVIAVGPDVPNAADAVVVGSAVLYHPAAEGVTNIGTGQVLVPLGAIAGVLDDPEHVRPDSSFFELPEWDVFRGKHYDEWEPFENVRRIVFKINFLESFRDVAAMGKPLYEHCVRELRKMDPEVLATLAYELHSGAEERKARVSVTSGDDVYDGVALIFDDAIQFGKGPTTVPNIVESLPPWFRAISSLVSDPVAVPFLGKDFSRARSVTWTIAQRIRLLGQGTRREAIQNSDLMQQFLMLRDPPKERATLGALGVTPESIGRVDLKLGFDRELDGHPYRIWANIQAPANDLYSLIEIEWEVQDLAPGRIGDRQYGFVIEYFLREVVFRGFYHRWFRENADIVCQTER